MPDLIEEFLAEQSRRETHQFSEHFVARENIAGKFKAASITVTKAIYEGDADQRKNLAREARNALDEVLQDLDCL